MKTERLLTETKRTCLTKTLLHHGSMPVMSPVDSHHLLGVLRGVEVLALSRVKQPDPVAQLAEFLHTPRPIFEGECERLFFCLVAQR